MPQKHHPPVITIFIDRWYVFAIPSHGWFMALVYLSWFIRGLELQELRSPPKRTSFRNQILTVRLVSWPKNAKLDEVDIHHNHRSSSNQSWLAGKFPI
jgi:hypothetical protein